MKSLAGKGFTLLELMVATGIFLAAAVGLLSLFVLTIQLADTAKNNTIATNATMAKIEEMRNSPFDSLATDYGSTGIPGNTFHINNWLSVNDHCGAVEISDVYGNARLYEVRVTVSWRQKSGRILGEDANFNGSLDAGEDQNGNMQLDSPAEIVTLISRRP